MRGEKDGKAVVVRRDPGSSPHARGKENDDNIDKIIFGIIPACAGKRSSRITTRYFLQDHPRMRGEKLLGF